MSKTAIYAVFLVLVNACGNASFQGSSSKSLADKPVVRDEQNADAAATTAPSATPQTPSDTDQSSDVIPAETLPPATDSPPDATPTPAPTSNPTPTPTPAATPTPERPLLRIYNLVHFYTAFNCLYGADVDDFLLTSSFAEVNSVLAQQPVSCGQWFRVSYPPYTQDFMVYQATTSTRVPLYRCLTPGQTHSFGTSAGCNVGANTESLLGYMESQSTADAPIALHRCRSQPQGPLPFAPVYPRMSAAIESANCSGQYTTADDVIGYVGAAN